MKLEKGEKLICRGYGYMVYRFRGRFYVDLGKPIIHSYETLVGVAETLYYGGYIDSKEVSALGKGE